MSFKLKPIARPFFVLPVLLATLPVAMSANQDAGSVLPPPSLYDSEPAPAQANPQPPVPAPRAAEPARAAEPPPAAKAQPAPQPATTTTRTSKPAIIDEPEREDLPWYQAMLPWNWDWGWTQRILPDGSSESRSDTPAPQPVERLGRDSGGARGQYAYSTTGSGAIRTGATGQCLKTGAWSPDAASADCDPSMQAKVPTETAASVETRTVQSPPRPVEVKPEPAQVVPLPTAPAKEELALAEPESDTEPFNETHLAAIEPLQTAPDAGEAAQAAAEQLTLSAEALFALSSSTIKPAGRKQLDEFAAKLVEMDYETVTIAGYTDPTGSAARNAKLSRDRANAVKKYLAAKGVDAQRMRTEGRGGVDPLAKEQDCDALPRPEKIVCYAPDRRVEIEVATR